MTCEVNFVNSFQDLWQFTWSEKETRRKTETDHHPE